MTPRPGHRAVVLGASIAGLLAARVLADCYDEVEVFDRDELPEHPGPRGGVPQARHAHALLAGGVLALEELLPGLVDAAEPVDPRPVRYRFPENLRRRYDRLDRFPRRLLAFGDAVTSTNPVNAQGMSVTAINALVLRDQVRRGEVPDGRGLARAMIRRTGATWDLSAGSNRSFDGVPGEPSPPARVIGRYVGRLQRAAVHEPAVALALLRVVQLLAPPPSLLRPDVLLRGLARRPAGKAAEPPRRLDRQMPAGVSEQFLPPRHAGTAAPRPAQTQAAAQQRSLRGQAIRGQALTRVSIVTVSC